MASNRKNGKNDGGVNSEGLTFEEWYAAANCFRSKSLSKEVALKAWLDGEDPTEYGND